MKTYRTQSGPFAEKPFFKIEEIEQICTDELQKLELYPTDPSPIRIDRFVEKRFKIRPTYLDLPDGLLGFTRFGRMGVEEIVVAKSFDDDGTKPAERRLRTTLAHESGHGLLHAHLFVLNSRPESLFGDGLASDALKILCREGGISGVGGSVQSKYQGHWWEYQANQAMGALLMPRLLVEKALSPMLVSAGVLGRKTLLQDRRDAATRSLAETFDVNPIVAKIRLEAVCPEHDIYQLTL